MWGNNVVAKIKHILQEALLGRIYSKPAEELPGHQSP